MIYNVCMAMANVRKESQAFTFITIFGLKEKRLRNREIDQKKESQRINQWQRNYFWFIIKTANEWVCVQVMQSHG